MELIIVQDARYDECACIFPNLHTFFKDYSDQISDLIFYEFEVSNDELYTEVEAVIALDMIQAASENKRIFDVNMKTVIMMVDKLSEKALEKFELR